MDSLAGIYMFVNRINGKVYIGESKDIRKRLKYYYWAAASTKDYHETTRTIIKALRKHGVENFDTKILECNDACKDTQYRKGKEIEYISKYNANDPKYGYNDSIGGELGPEKPRPQSTQERMKRMIPIIVFDTKKNKAILYFGGAKALADRLGYERTIITRNIKRGSLIDNRYYAFYYEYDKRIEVYDKLKAKKTSAPKDNSLHSKDAKRRSIESFYAYSNIYDIVNDCY